MKVYDVVARSGLGSRVGTVVHDKASVIIIIIDIVIINGISLGFGVDHANIIIIVSITVRVEFDPFSADNGGVFGESFAGVVRLQKIAETLAIVWRR